MALAPLKLTRNQKDRFGRIRTLEQLKQMDPTDFEYFCGYLYQKAGYTVSHMGKSGDEGVDLYLKKGRQTTVVQCKRYAGTVGQPTVRDLYGTMLHNQASAAALVTTGTVSRQAEQWAANKPINLIDGHELMSWANQYRRAGLAGGDGGLPSWLLGLAGLLLLLAICGGASFGLFSVYRERQANATPPPALVIPTSVAADEPTPAATVAPTETDVLPPIISIGTETVTVEPIDVGTPAATVTLAPDVDPTETEVPPEEEPTAELEATPVAQENGRVTAARFGFRPTIDGNGGEWPNGMTFSSPHITERTAAWDGSLDVAAIWQLGWDADNLYLLVNVTDDTHVQTQPAQFAYRGDSLELQFDTNRVGDLGPSVNRDDYQYVVSPGNFLDRDAGSFRFRGDNAGSMSDFLGSQAQVAVQQRTDGYTLEMALPWSDLSLSAESGLVIGAAFSVNDLDEIGAARQELLLSHIASRRWIDPSSWGELELLP